MSELKRCPFCGKPARDLGNNHCQCAGSNCFSGNNQMLTSHWNTRPIEADLEAQLSAQTETVSELMKAAEIDDGKVTTDINQFPKHLQIRERP